ncbi:hypothetical protein QEN19_002132 [Hanseniaspora menglaensis]
MFRNVFLIKTIKLRTRNKVFINFALNRTLFSTNNSNPNNNQSFFHTIKIEIDKSREYCTDQYSKLLKNLSKQKNKINELSILVQSASTSINKITGYDTIQSLKNSIKSIELQLYQDRIILEQEAHQLKLQTKKQSNSQALINDLLSRKSTWSPQDLKIFTDSYNENQHNIQKLNEQTKKSTDLEKTVKTMEQDLHNLILKRYHEEQVWSDKIRKLSTYGTLLLLVINLLSFFILHLIFEPRKRRRLVAAFEKETKDYIEEIKDQQIEQMKRLENLITMKMDILVNEKSTLLMEERTERENSIKFKLGNFVDIIKRFGQKITQDKLGGKFLDINYKKHILSLECEYAEML